jgi:hypothetical protein
MEYFSTPYHCYVIKIFENDKKFSFLVELIDPKTNETEEIPINELCPKDLFPKFKNEFETYDSCLAFVKQLISTFFDESADD